MRKLISKPEVRVWLAIVGAATLVLGAAYVMVQQSTRLAADDAPLVAAQNARDELATGSKPDNVVSDKTVNLRTDGDTFVIVTDNSKHVLASSARLDGKTPLPPAGVFDYARINGDDHFTWQPANGVRLATRVMTYSQDINNGYIIAGQSLAQAENRENRYTAMAIAAWLATLAWVSLVLLLPQVTPLANRKIQKAKRGTSQRSKN